MTPDEKEALLFACGSVLIAALLIAAALRAVLFVFIK
jgi:hypothetical protein